MHTTSQKDYKTTLLNKFTQKYFTSNSLTTQIIIRLNTKQDKQHFMTQLQQLKAVKHLQQLKAANRKLAENELANDRLTKFKLTNDRLIK